MRRFGVTVSMFVDLEIEDGVLDVVDQEWRSKFYNLDSEARVLQYLAYHLIVDGKPLSEVVGWTDHADHQVSISDSFVEEIHIEEIPNDLAGEADDREASEEELTVPSPPVASSGPSPATPEGGPRWDYGPGEW